MRHLVHDAAVDLLDAGLAVDDDVVEVVYEQGDDLPQIGVDGAVAAGGLGPADREKGEAPLFGHRLKEAEARLGQDVLRVAQLARHVRGHALADIVERLRHRDAQRGREPHGGVGVDREDPRLGLFLGQQAHDRGGDGGLPDAALAREGDYDSLVFHGIPPPAGSRSFLTDIMLPHSSQFNKFLPAPQKNLWKTPFLLNLSIGCVKIKFRIFPGRGLIKSILFRNPTKNNGKRGICLEKR